MALEDFQAIRRLREAEAHLFEHLPPAPLPKRIILYSVDPWQLGVVEQFLHVAFELKGHRPRTLFDDGLLPLCAWEYHHVGSPRPGAIEKRSRYVFGAFGINPVGISTYLDGPRSKAHAEVFVDAATRSELGDLTYSGIPIGALALRDLFQYTVGHFTVDTAEDAALYRKHLIHAIMSVDLAHAIIEKDQPDIVVLVNGKAVMYTYLYEVCRALGVQVTTWEEGMYWDTSIVLANNDRAIDFPISEDEWRALRALPFDEGQRRAVETYFDRWRRQEATSYVYYDNEERDFGRISRELGIPEGRRLISIFSNIVWDTNALGKDRAFSCMMDWINSTVEFVKDRPDDFLIIRAHPAECRWALKTRTPVRQLVDEHFPGRLPENVRIIDGDSEFSSYEIARHSHRCAVYTSTLGAELTMTGQQPLICGVPFYADKGVTNDIHTRAEYFEFLGGGKEPDGGNPKLLKRFMYHVLFDLVKRPEFLVGIHTDPQCPKVKIDTFEGFPESMPVFNEIVEAILENGSFVRSATTPMGDIFRGGLAETPTRP
jgi:hypothetical protein